MDVEKVHFVIGKKVFSRDALLKIIIDFAQKTWSLDDKEYCQTNFLKNNLYDLPQYF